MQKASTVSPQNLKVLIVEDETLIAHDIRDLLREWGYQVADIATSASEAVQFFREQSPDLALVDVQLFGAADGVEAVQKINEIRRVPIVYLTAQADTPTVERAKKTNPAAYLLKPFDERHLQISLDLAFANFYHESPSGGAQNFSENTALPHPSGESNPVFAHEVKLGGEVILRKGDEVFIKQNYRFVKFKNSQIVCLEADRNHTFIHTTEQKFVVRIPLTTVLERLSDAGIVRVHRSFAINIKLVESFDDTEIIVAGKSIPFTSTYRSDFFKNFNVL